MASARSNAARGLILAAALCAARAALAGPLALVPMPREVTPRGGVTTLGPGWVVSAGGTEDDAAARVLTEEAERGSGWAWRIAPGSDGRRRIELRAGAPPADAPAGVAGQSYTLDIAPGRVVIVGATPQARFYGAQTLRQLLRAHPDGVIPCLRIRDWPALKWRGISDDISRGQASTLADFKDIIRQLAYYKINLYQLYIEDMFRFAGRPTSGGVYGALTPGELAELVAEGRRYHVVVSPIFETLAHQERLLSQSAMRRFAADGAEGAGAWEPLLRTARDIWSRLAPGGSGASPAGAFSARDPRTLAFVQSLVDEIATVTRGPFFHIGGDEWEPPGAAAGGEAMRAYGRYLGALARHLERRFGCRAMVYGDVILANPEAARDLPRDVVVVDWHYDLQDSFPSLERLRALGFRDVVVSPALWTWKAFYPNYARAFRNIAGFAQAGKRAGAIGCVTAAWGDGGAESLRENNWAGYAFAAAAAWEAAAPEEDRFLRRFAAAHYGSDAPGLYRAEKLLGWQDFERIGWGGRLYHRPLPVRPLLPSTVERMTALAADMRVVERDLAGADPLVRFRRDHLAVVRHCARRYRYVAERDLALGAAGVALEGRTAAQLPPAERERIAADLDGLAAAADSLTDEFGRLWLTRNRPQGLETNRLRMARQGVMLRRLSELARSGRLGVDATYSNMQALSGTGNEEIAARP